MSHDSLGDRMKEYEAVSQTHLIRRMPVIIRLDGKAFHTFTKRLKHLDPDLKTVPFSSMMKNAMQAAALAVHTEVQNATLTYTQSDEISILIRDWDTLETQSWFGNNVQKMVSIAASTCTNGFNFKFHEYQKPEKLSDYAKFDARVYNLPKEEVVNYFIWRQNDASRNSVQMLGHYHFSQKQMHGKKNSEVHDMLMLEKGVNWNDLPTWMKRGSCITRSSAPDVKGLHIDDDIPIFSQDRNYVGKHLRTPAEQQELEEVADLLLTI